MAGRIRHLAAIAASFLVLLLPAAADAGQLVLRNTSQQPITCTVDGWTAASGFSFDLQVTVQPQRNYLVGQNSSRAGGAVINWANCGNLRTRAMNITPNGPDGTLVLNGQQTRVLNVALYSWIPNPANATFGALVNHVIDTFQQANPQVLLNAQMNPVAQNTSGTKIYSFTDLPVLLTNGQPAYGGSTAGGFDVMELDTLYLAFLAQGRYINRAQIAGDQPFPVALAASSWNGELWGIPCWLCMDFIFSFDQNVRQATSLPALLQFLGGAPSGEPRMVGTYNGSWRLPSIYINAYVQTHGWNSINQAMTGPIDGAVIDNLVSLTNTCADAGANNCTNGTYYGSSVPGVTEQVFAHQQAFADMGFSEQSFYILSYGQQQPPALYATPAAWGDTVRPLLFSDTFVTSSANCPPNSPCAGDAAAFTTLMTGAAMKTYIVQSQDLPNGSPWRRLLVATQPFYQQQQIASDPIYQQLVPVLTAAQTFPNDWNAAAQNRLKYGVCRALQQRTTYDCDPGPGAALLRSRQVPPPVAVPAPARMRELEDVR